VIKDEAVISAYDQFHVDVANLSAHELPYISHVMAGADFARQLEAHPILKRLVSANMVGQASFAPSPYLIRELKPKSSATALKPVRIAFIGLAEPGAVALKGLKITNPIEAARRVLPEAKRQADLVILLAHMKTDLVTRIAREVPGIDIIIAGNGEYFTPPIRLGQTLVLFTANETRMLGEIRFYRDAQGQITNRVRYISLDEQVPQDATAMRLVVSVRDALRALGEERARLVARLNTHRNQDPLTQNGYVSAQSCGKCHLPQYMHWANSDHARATDRLFSQQSEFDASCLSCHASGMGSAMLPNVQCEQCHGPAADHIAKPSKGYGRIKNAKALCSNCHTAQTSLGFDFQAYWAKIKH
jgi:hypothetical protein